MNKDEKLAVQKILIETFQALEREQPTLLLDTLMNGTGASLVAHALGSQEAYSRKRADTLKYLLKVVQQELAVYAAPQVPEPEEDSEEEED